MKWTPPGMEAGGEALALWLKGQIPTAGRAVWAAIGLGLLSGFFLVFQSWYLAKVLDAVIIGGKALSQVMPWLWSLLPIFLARALTAWFSEQTAFLASSRIKEDIRSRLFRHLQALGPAYLYGKETGNLTITMVDGVEALEGYFSGYLPQRAIAALVPLTMLGFVLCSDWPSAAILAIGGPLIPLFMYIIGKGAEYLNRRHWKKLAAMSAYFLDVIQGLTTLKLFDLSRQEAELISRMSDEYRKSAMSVLRVAFLSSLALEFFSTLSVALVAILLGFRLLWGWIDFQLAFFVLLLAPEFFWPLRKLGARYHSRMEAIGAVQGMVEVLNAPIPERGGERDGKIEAARELGIAFRDVSFSYEEGRPALSGLSFRMEPGETVALVGQSGGGKSTTASLLLRFIRPQRGTITMNGVDLEECSLEAWHGRVAWVPQRPRIFHATVAENIRLGRPEAEMDRVREAARLAQAEPFIERLPEGYDTRVGEGGQPLSGGQRQMIAIARAYLKDAPLVVLDEATANLDPETQDLVLAAVGRLARGRTMLMIAHRLSTIRLADRIVLIDRGRAVEEGTHEELLARKGSYARMVDADRRKP